MHESTGLQVDQSAKWLTASFGIGLFDKLSSYQLHELLFIANELDPVTLQISSATPVLLLIQ